MSIVAIVEQALATERFTVCEVGFQDHGQRSVQRWGEGRQQLFDLASLTKLFTTTVVLRLIDRRQLSLHTPINRLLPIKDRALERRLEAIDVAMLLTHSSSLIAWYPLYVHGKRPLLDILGIILEKERPMDGMCYSDLNFLLLGLIIEQVMQQPLDEALQSMVLDPLGLESTTYRPFGADCVPTEWGNRIERAMVGERNLFFAGWRDEGIAIQGEANDGNAFYWANGVAPHAGLFSTTDDVLSLANAYIEGFITPVLQRMVFSDWGGGQGLGWRSGPIYGDGGWGHTGFTGTYLCLHRESQRLVTIMSDRLHVPQPQNIDDVRRAIAQALLTHRP